MMVSRVTLQAAGGLAFLTVVLAAALFVPARTLDYWQAWAFLAVFVTTTAVITLDLARHDPALLARRVKAGPLAEPSLRQKLIQLAASLAFLAIFVVSALDRRCVPTAIVLAGDVLVALGLAIVAMVFRANTFASAVVAVEREQRLVTAGPYAIVRHPMYAGAFVMLLGTPLALGSWYALAPVAVLYTAIIWRLLDEEKLLAAQLPGYDDYRARVTKRIVPFVW